MVPPERRTRRARQSDQVIDLRTAAATRKRAAEPTRGTPEPPDTDLAAADRPLLDAVRRHAGQGALPGLHELGRHAGARATRDLAAEVEAAPPRLDTHDAAGERVDRVVVHPGWRSLLRDGTQAGLTGRPWVGGEPHGHVVRAASLLLWAQVSGSAAMSAVAHHAAAAAVSGSGAATTWLPRLASRRVDLTSRRGGGTAVTTAGLALTERSGGSGPHASAETRASEQLGGPVDGGPTWRLSGRKWFAGNADADALVVSAAVPDGEGLFLLPRRLGDGEANGLRVQRLRHGSSRRAWVVGDVELDGAWAVRLDAAPAAPGRHGAPAGAAAPAHGTQAVRAAQALDATVLAAATLRGALWHAGHHCRRTSRAEGPLDTAPLVRTMLADLAVEQEAATVLALRLAAATDAAQQAGHEDAAREAALLRLATPVAALWLSRRAPQATLEAVELLGASAWDARSPVSRLHGEAGTLLAGATGNGLATEVVDVVGGDPDAVEALLLEIGLARGAHPRLDAAVDACGDLLRTAAAEARQDRGAVEGAARWLAERVAVVLQAGLVVRHCPAPVADAFVAARVESTGTRGLGTLPLGGRQTALVVDRALGEV